MANYKRRRITTAAAPRHSVRMYGKHSGDVAHRDLALIFIYLFIFIRPKQHTQTCVNAKPNVSPPGCTTSRLLIVNWSIKWFACVQRILYANAVRRMSPELTSLDKANKNWLPRQRPLRDRKNNFRLMLTPPRHWATARVGASQNNHNSLFPAADWNRKVFS